MNSNALSVNSGSNSLESNKLLSIADKEAFNYLKNKNQQKTKSIQQKIDKYFNKLQEYKGSNQMNNDGYDAQRTINDEIFKKYQQKNQIIQFKPALWQEVIQNENQLINGRNQRFNSTYFEKKDSLKANEKIRINQTEANIFNDKRIQLQSQKNERVKSKANAQFKRNLSGSYNNLDSQKNEMNQKSENHLSLWKGMNEKNWLNIKMNLKCLVSGKKSIIVPKDEQINIQPIKNKFDLLKTYQNDQNQGRNNNNNKTMQSSYNLQSNRFKQRQNSCNLTVQFQKRRRVLQNLKNIKLINQNNQQANQNFDTKIDILSDTDNQQNIKQIDIKNKYNSRTYFTTKSSVVTKSNVFSSHQNQNQNKNDTVFNFKSNKGQQQISQAIEKNEYLQIQSSQNQKQNQNNKSYGILQPQRRTNVQQQKHSVIKFKKLSSPIMTDFSIDIIKSLNEDNQENQQDNHNIMNFTQTRTIKNNNFNYGILKDEKFENNDAFYQIGNAPLIEIQKKNPLIELQKIESKCENIFTIQENIDSQNQNSYYENERAFTTQMFDNNLFKKEIIKKKKKQRVKSSNQQIISHFLKEHLQRNQKANRMVDKIKMDQLQIQGSKKVVKYHPALQTVIDKIQNKAECEYNKNQVIQQKPCLTKSKNNEDFLNNLRVSSQHSKSPLANNVDLQFKTNDIKTDMIHSPADSSCTKSQQINHNFKHPDYNYYYKSQI